MKMTPAEMNEQVALRLRWKKSYGTFEGVTGVYTYAWCSPEGIVIYGANLPPWFTDDGLAFKELWPRIEKHCWACSIGRSRRSGPPNLSIYYAGAPGTQQDFWGDTWAEAICAAFIDLVPLEETR